MEGQCVIMIVHLGYFQEMESWRCEYFLFSCNLTTKTLQLAAGLFLRDWYSQLQTKYDMWHTISNSTPCLLFRKRKSVMWSYTIFKLFHIKIWKKNHFSLFFVSSAPYYRNIWTIVLRPKWSLIWRHLLVVCKCAG